MRSGGNNIVSIFMIRAFSNTNKWKVLSSDYRLLGVCTWSVLKLGLRIPCQKIAGMAHSVHFIVTDELRSQTTYNSIVETQLHTFVPNKQEAQLLLGDRATRKHAKDS